MGHSIDHPTPAPPAAFSDLDGTNGFAVHGLNESDFLGMGVGGSGDVNGDGLDDLLISAPLSDPDGLVNAGTSYVIFGKTGGFAPVFDQTTLDGSNGFRTDGILAGDAIGVSIANAGDIDGDGLADMIVGTTETDPDGKVDAGSSYAVLGSDQGAPPDFDLATLDGNNGFRIDGATAGDYSGSTVSSLGDVNGDGFDDMIIEASPVFSSPTAGHYVVFGSDQGFPSSLDLASLDGNNGFWLSGSDRDFGINDIGDINGDGFDDIAVSVTFPPVDMFSTVTPSVNVVFGTDQGFPARLDLPTVDGITGFNITNIFGYVISGAGDFNGDGIADIVIGDSFFQDGLNGADVGHVYIIFGTTQGFPATLDGAALDGGNGFRIEGGAAGDALGYSVSSTGDINGDGLDDVVIAQQAVLSDYFMYVVYGSDQQFPPIVDIATLNESQAFQIAVDRVIDGDFWIQTSDAGDVNGDGFGDFITGSIAGGPNGLNNAGKASAVFGDDFTASVTHAGGAADDALVGTPSGDVMVGGLGDDFVQGNGGRDVLTGGTGDDILVVADAGFQRVDGGGGRDRLKVDGFDLDLTAIPDLRVRDIEIVDLGDASTNQVTLALRDLRTMSDSSNTITITGDAGDKVVIDLTGTGFQPTNLGNGFIEYTAQSADNGLSLMVQDSLDLSGIVF